MSDQAHSPGPFGIQETETGFILVDAMGDSIGALAKRTGDHPPEEQLANAKLFQASPALLRAAKLGRAAIAQDRALTIEAHTVPLAGTLEPDLSTLEDMAVEVIAELDARLSEIDAAIAMAEGRK